jgi:hypothetical protein
MGLLNAYRAASIANTFERECLRLLHGEPRNLYKRDYAWGTATGNRIFDAAASVSRKDRLSNTDDFALTLALFFQEAKGRSDVDGVLLFDYVASAYYGAIRDSLSYKVDKLLLDSWITNPPF